jgi:hypothetical protein
MSAQPNKKDDSGQPLELIDASDFRSLKLQISVVNTTTETRTSKNDKNIRLVEIQNRGMTLEIPTRKCNEGHNLIIEIVGTTPRKKEFKFSCTAKVEKLEPGNPLQGEHVDRIDVIFMQYDEHAWEDFLYEFSQRQAEILDFFERAKGLK